MDSIEEYERDVAAAGKTLRKEWCCTAKCRRRLTCAKHKPKGFVVPDGDRVHTSLEVGGVDCYVPKDGKEQEGSL